MRELIQNLICAGLDAGLCGQVGLEGVGGEGADGVLRHLEAAAVVNVSDWKEENTNEREREKKKQKKKKAAHQWQKHRDRCCRTQLH